MFRRNTYYTLKPLIPVFLRRAVRGYFARRRLRNPAVQAVWPILESAGDKPAGWPGWPEGKQFAFVLTHDVESAKGLANVRQLAELEMSLGFRSSFNFIPEGDYIVPEELRSWLEANGFEVGVHDLHHDGKLYRSREEFAYRAKRINGYIHEWGAVGYRSGFMLHNYAWHHDLDVLYDASSFDTDPFEPQPDGVGTIFPFFVPRPRSEERGQQDDRTTRPQDTERQQDHRTTGPQDLNSPVVSGPVVRSPVVSGPPAPRAGYVELPYTLPQDSTLFFLLRETTDRIWQKKLEWVAGKGGMALLNTHPDYMGFGSGQPAAGTFSVEIYAGFLRHVRDVYATVMHHSLAQHIARDPHVWPSLETRPMRPPRRIGMVTYSVYESDNRVRRYAESLARRGDIVEVLAVKARREDPREVEIDGVRVTRLVPKKSLRSNLLSYFTQVSWFFFGATAMLSARALKRPYDLVHVHNMPDFLVFAGPVARLRGARIILDLHDLVPELFADKMSGWKRRFAGGLLRWEERLSAAFSHHVIVSNHLWLDDIVARSASREKCSVFINNVDTRIFRPMARTRRDERRVILFHGSLSRHQGVDLVISAMPAIRARVPSAEFHVYGSGAELHALREQATCLGVDRAVRFMAPVALHQMPPIIADADVGVVAKRADGFGNRAYSTKIMEFLSQGIPVALSRTEIDQFYFDESVARFFDSEDVDGIASALIEILTDDDLAARLSQCARSYVANNDWTTRQRDYLGLVDALIERRALPSGLRDAPIRPVPAEATSA